MRDNLLYQPVLGPGCGARVGAPADQLGVHGGWCMGAATQSMQSMRASRGGCAPSPAASLTRVAVGHREHASRGCDVTAIPVSRPSLCRGADRRVAAEELLNELVQQMLRGPVQMLGIAVPRIAVG